MNVLIAFLIMAGANSDKIHFRIKSTAFSYGKMIPVEYTCDGEDVSPEIVFENIPSRARSMALIADDPDAPMGTWVHWVIYNIPPDTLKLQKDFPQEMKVESICQGKNDFRKYGYGGPCPPKGVHRYFFKAYVLDTIFSCDKSMTKKKLLNLMKGHIIATDTLMGKYKRR